MSRILQLSEAASLALHGMAFMASRPGESFSVRQISETFSVSEHHLSKVMQRLVKAGLLASTRGPKGGFTLSVPPENLSLLDVYEAVEGKMDTGACPVHRVSCGFQNCILGDLGGRFSREVTEYLKTKKLSDFAPRSERKES